MKKIKLLLMIVLFCLLCVCFVGCKKEETPTPDPTPEPTTTPTKKIDVDYPTELVLNNEESIAIHYIRSDNKYSRWCLWLWDPTGQDDNMEDDFNYLDEDGVIAYYPLSHFGALNGGKLGIIIKTKGSWTKDGTESDRYIEMSKYPMDSNKIHHVYFFGGDPGMYQTKDKTMADEIESVLFVDENNISITTSNKMKSISIYKGDVLVETVDNINATKYTYYLKEKANLAYSYKVKVLFSDSNKELEKAVGLTNLYDTDFFNNEFYYDGELGAIYSKEETKFYVWSPVSTDIKLRLYDNGTPVSVSKEKGSDEYTEYTLTKGDKGVFSTTVKGDLHGKYYTYVVTNGSNNGIEIVDPYAKAAGINGIRGLIVDFSRTNPEGFEEMNYLDIDRLAMVVWETHVADVTSSSTWNGPAELSRKYLGLIEEGTTYTEGDKTVATGFDHIKELGVNAVQLLPVFDQANDETKYEFNWGYNPLNYNVVEGMYSSDPYDGLKRITELKQVIMKFNQNGITTIMDVVYNHVNGANGSNFDVLMPGYYFRYNSDGSLSNGSGCGNEVASERKMVSRFIVDSCKFWTEEYKFGGFRFDLMGLIDLDTMANVVKEVEKINPNAVIYGEPWQGGSSPLNPNKAATQANGPYYEGYGAFNDKTRDALIKGGLSSKETKGWITNENTPVPSDVIMISKGINGITYNSSKSITDPNKNVIYVTCHDNYTLYDRIKAAGITDEAKIKQMALLANAIVLTSSGTAFLLAGEEMLRTKQGDSNSYKSSDEVNQLDYSLLIKNYDLFEQYKALIAFKINNSGLHLDNPEINVENLNSNSVLKYTIMDGEDEYLIIHANGSNHGFSVDTSLYEVVINTLDNDFTPSATSNISSFQTLVLKKK